MANKKPVDLVSTRMKRSSRTRFKTRAAKEGKDLYEVIDEASKR